MDRALFKAYFTEKSVPDWSCPTCRKSILRIKEGTFHTKETHASGEEHDNVAWSPEWIRYTYACLFECTNDSCKEVVASCGNGNVGYDFSFDGDGEFVDFYQPQFFNPHLQIFDIPSNCPSAIKEELDRSFKQFFSSPDAALNSARAAIEQLVTELGVKRYQTQNGKRRPVNLHARINMLGTQHSQIKDMLIAIKWLGNAGSHPGAEISVDDVLDSYELIEHVLHELFGGKAKAMKALARKVNKRKGPKNKT
jgi:hypothetical protein